MPKAVLYSDKIFLFVFKFILDYDTIRIEEPEAVNLSMRKARHMRISARNQLKGVISAVKNGAVNGIVVIELGESSVSADITMESIKDLGIAEGKEAIAIIKASNVMFAAGSERIAGISARNQLVGTVSTIRKGAVNGHVALELADGNVITGSITNASIDDLGLEVGSPAVAIVTPPHLLGGVENRPTRTAHRHPNHKRRLIRGRFCVLEDV